MANLRRVPCKSCRTPIAVLPGAGVGLCASCVAQLPMPGLLPEFPPVVVITAKAPLVAGRGIECLSCGEGAVSRMRAVPVDVLVCTACGDCRRLGA